MYQVDTSVLEILAATQPDWDWQLLEKKTALSPLQEPTVAASRSRIFPLTDPTGQVVGQLIAWPRGNRVKSDVPLPAKAEQLITLLTPLLAELLVTRSKLRAAEALALVDPLTQLANRRAWEAALAREERRCQRAKHPAAIICLDLDRLKEQNDTAGHAAGDELLQKTADALRRAIRAHDIAARLGGDEFGILLVECAGDCMPQIIARLKSALQDAGIEATLGWAARMNDADLHATWSAADQALIAAKHS